MEKESKTITTNYINLQTIGKLFPIWVMQNFKKYKIPDKFQDESADKSVKKIKLYQEFLSKFLDYNSIYRSILIYHQLGTGKTITTINIYNMLFNYSPSWNVFILLKASLEQQWIDELKIWLDKTHYSDRRNNIHFVHYNSPIADKAFLDEIRNSDSNKKNLYIIDEVHNFIKNVHGNINTKKGQRALKIYDYIKNERQNEKSTRVITISATPSINNPFELALLFNLLEPNIFPNNEPIFNEIFLKNDVLNPERKNLFQRRILGLVSYYNPSNLSNQDYAKKIIENVEIKMSKYQSEIYKHFKIIEDNLQHVSKTYKTYTRQAVNFVFPHISDKITGEKRPRPHEFKLSEKQLQLIDENKISNLDIEKRIIDNYKNTILLFINGFKKYISTFQNELQNDVKEFLKYDNVLTFIEKGKKSKIFQILFNCSCKMSCLCLNIFKSEGGVLLYSNYVLLEGLEILKIYLELFGYKKYDQKSTNPLHYIEYHGGIDQVTRDGNLKEYNSNKNIDASIIKVFLLSPAGSEGITLKNTRQVHILEPYWHETRIEQVIGRAVRLNSHSLLPKEKQIVNIYKYYALLDNGTTTIDGYVQKISTDKQKLVDSFLDMLKESAIDCELNKNVNMSIKKYNCFQFPEESYFEEYINPAYKFDINQDIKISSGLNSINSVSKIVKTYKIKAVKQINDTSYSQPVSYWYNPTSNVIYDFDLYFPIAKLKVDINNIPIKLNITDYIIDSNNIINIPII